MKRLARKQGLLLDRSVDDDQRCRTCGGVCCRAFPNVELSWHEYEVLRALGAQRLEIALGGPCHLMIENGCEFLVDGRCSIYEHRPAVCRHFFCADE